MRARVSAIGFQCRRINGQMPVPVIAAVVECLDKGSVQRRGQGQEEEGVRVTAKMRGRPTEKPRAS